MQASQMNLDYDKKESFDRYSGYSLSPVPSPALSTSYSDPRYSGVNVYKAVPRNTGMSVMDTLSSPISLPRSLSSPETNRKSHAPFDHSIILSEPEVDCSRKRKLEEPISDFVSNKKRRIEYEDDFSASMFNSFLLLAHACEMIRSHQ
eukprot:TRINITY_DN395_c0_g1_i2.p1 TRINITY_DN395_c0_g1~~TRINITY_DN395_c0_g1_i2.p1  ORF type:complete len:148 (+),score=22.21 TRINITY_DN395_c0_g1_i2:429-872(+)